MLLFYISIFNRNDWFPFEDNSFIGQVFVFIKGFLMFFQYFQVIISENSTRLCLEKSIVENNFETIRFYSIEKKFVPICILIIGFVFE